MARKQLSRCSLVDLPSLVFGIRGRFFNGSVEERWACVPPITPSLLSLPSPWSEPQFLGDDCGEITYPWFFEDGTSGKSGDRLLAGLRMLGAELWVDIATFEFNCSKGSSWATRTANEKRVSEQQSQTISRKMFTMLLLTVIDKKFKGKEKRRLLDRAMLSRANFRVFINDEACPRSTYKKDFRPCCVFFAFGGFSLSPFEFVSQGVNCTP